MNFDYDGLKWIFAKWKVTSSNKLLSKWRLLSAICKDTCTKQVKEVHVLYQQWLPIPVNTPQLIAPDAAANTPDLVDSVKGIIDTIMDIIEDIQKAPDGTDEDVFEKAKKTGDEVCDRFNLYWRKPR